MHKKNIPFAHSPVLLPFDGAGFILESIFRYIIQKIVRIVLRNMAGFILKINTGS
jgi:hypothetical protein